MTQDTDECPNRQLYTDISAWITDAKIFVRVRADGSIMASTRGIRVRFDPFGDICRHSSRFAPRMRN